MTHPPPPYLAGRLICLDVETWRVQPGNIAPRLVVGSWAEGDQNWLTGPDETCAYLAEVLPDPRVSITNHNIDFDVRATIEHAPSLLPLWWAAYREGRVYCTLVRERLLDLAVGDLQEGAYSLAAVAKKRLGLDIAETKKGADAWRVRYDELDGLPLDEWPDEARAYALDDSAITLRAHVSQDLAARQIGVVDASGRIVDEGPKAWAHFALGLWSQWGARTEAARVDETEAALEEAVGDILSQLAGVGIVKADGKLNRKALQAAILTAYEARGEAPPYSERAEAQIKRHRERIEKTQGQASATRAELAGLPSLGLPARALERKRASLERRAEKASALVAELEAGARAVGVSYGTEALLGSGDPLLTLYGVRARDLWHIGNTIPKLREGTIHPINARYTLPMASGRTSSRSPNIQNLPRKAGFRECFVPRPGRVFVGADYSQLELCTLAQIWQWLFGSSSMAGMIQAGMDLHLVLASEFLGEPYGSLSKRTHKKQRDFAKEGNYGFPVGMGDEKFHARMLKSISRGGLSEDLLAYTVEDVGRLKGAWRKIYPESGRYFGHVERLCALGAPVRQFVSGRWRGDLRFTAIGNSFFQGLAADGALSAVIQVTEECYLDKSSPLYGSRPWAFIHDEIQLETPEDVAHEAAMRLSEIMVEKMQEYTPDVPIEAEPLVARRWSKAAEPTWARGGTDGPADANDRLVPWESQ